MYIIAYYKEDSKGIIRSLLRVILMGLIHSNKVQKCPPWVYVLIHEYDTLYIGVINVS